MDVDIAAVLNEEMDSEELTLKTVEAISMDNQVGGAELLAIVVVGGANGNSDPKLTQYE